MMRFSFLLSNDLVLFCIGRYTTGALAICQGVWLKKSELLQDLFPTPFRSEVNRQVLDDVGHARTQRLDQPVYGDERD